MNDRNTRNRPQNIGSMISQAIASLRHWVSNKDLEIIKKSGIATLVVSSKFPWLLFGGKGKLRGNEMEKKNEWGSQLVR